MQIELTSLITSIKHGDYDSDRLQISPNSFEISNGAFAEMANPKYSRGASGVVFYAESTNGNSLAIRFPLGDLPNPEYWGRMKSISSMQSSGANNFSGGKPLVPFEVVDHAIMVGGQWISAIVMPNLKDSKALGDRVKEYYRLGMREKLLEISEALSNLGRFLERTEWDHGDISPGNIMVSSNGEISLIDPDTLRHSRIRDPPVRELGHPCCSHPRRSTREMEEDLFLFPLRLLILQVDYLSSIIGQGCPIYPDDDDEILISDRDLKDPNSSELFQKMAEEGFKVPVEQITRACSCDSIPEANNILSRFIVENPIPNRNGLNTRNRRSLTTFKPRPNQTNLSRRSGDMPLTIPGSLSKAGNGAKSTPATPRDIERVVSETRLRFADGQIRNTSKVAKRIRKATGIDIKETARRGGMSGFVDILNNSSLNVYFEGRQENPHEKVAILPQ